MSFDIGPLGNIASTEGSTEGRIVGLNAATSILTDLSPVAAERAMMRRQARRRPAKDYNDQPADTTVGSQGNQAVKEKPVSWMPPW
jgi:hypothetical protein